MYYRIGVLLIIGTYFSATTALPPCVCTREEKPVCGSDGQTYSNECMLNCAKSINPEISVQSAGRCKREAPNCFCTYEYNPICGSDGETYPNECAMRCRQAESPELRASHKGACRKSRQVKVASLSRCTCPRDSKQVCGNDGNTYENGCLLNCASEANPRLYVVHGGPCDNGVKVVDYATNNPSCTCGRDYKPICASNGVTFGNECLMACSGSDLTVARDGPCEAK